MIRIAILEDDPADLLQLEQCLRRYEQEQQEHFSIDSFSHPSVFLDQFKSNYDLVFLDIQLPMVNGMEVARQLRASDDVFTLIFITNLEQYAVEGYSVDALDFVVKPINYCRFSSMLRKALRKISRQQEKEFVLQSSGNLVRLRLSQIYYVEIRDHLLIYHTELGNFTAWGKMAEVEQQLAEHDFARCSTSHLVNLHHVSSLSGNDVVVAGTKLPISQRRRKSFYACVTSYLCKT